MKEPWYLRLKRWWYGACPKHPDQIYDSHILKICNSCWRDSDNAYKNKEREEKIEIIKEAIVRAKGLL